ncbi:hypothetical protein ANOM_000102 [Aspergillus nomiae NRRL 13137]|uniref:F-box domain protein n=1 Tax=Aspergillus nomiae NRRL (strain ATCC 15546 / NRRL 13137 / CBS 260.88 / M93) TaxID=1509407 RepID=A0A0L1JIG5_ASPN3|nr:uncharacterized protein ANOM_000102 [Aspergillus nomiae NRRL 13137]KNG91497.1 hypothetical protein ANOM_000102 [Aspergillus nomiae NRRL 13137]
MLPCRGLVLRHIFPISGTLFKRLAPMVISNSFQFEARRGICQLQSNGNDNFHTVRLRSPTELKRGLQILLSILREPSLAGEIRELKLDRTPGLSYRGDPYEIRPTQVLLPTEDLQRLQLAVKNAGLEGRGEDERVLNILLQDISKSRSSFDKYLYFQAQALAVMLVSLAPRLESLAFCPLGLQQPLETYMFENFLRRAIAEKRDVPGLRNLRSVRFLSDIDNLGDDGTLYWDYEVHDCLNLIRELPTIESVRFDGIQPSLDVGMWPPPRSANYTDIMFYHCIMHSPEELDIILQSAKRLRKFVFTVGGRSERGYDISPVSPIDTLESLLTHRHTLEELDLDIQGHLTLPEMLGEDHDAFHSGSFDEDEELEKWVAQKKEILAVESPAPECSLRSFPNLKHLSIGTHVLYSYTRGFGAGRLKEPFSLIDNLPPRLESLRLYGYGLPGEYPHRSKRSLDLDVEAQIAMLLKQKDTKLPSLKVIEGIDTPIPHGHTVEDCTGDRHLLWQREDDERRAHNDN